MTPQSNPRPVSGPRSSPQSAAGYTVAGQQNQAAAGLRGRLGNGGAATGAAAAVPANGSPNLSGGASGALASAASGPLAGPGEGSSLELPLACARMPVALQVTVPVRDFRVRNLLAMTPGQVIRSSWGHGDDLPISSGDVQLAWGEFEVVDTTLAVRVTRLA